MRPQRQKTLLARDHIMALQLQHKWTFRTIAGASSPAARKANKATKAASAACKLSAVPPVNQKMSAAGEVAPSPKNRARGLENDKWLPHAAVPPEPHAGGKRKHPVGGYAEVAARRHPAADAPRAADGAAHAPTLSDRQNRHCSARARARVLFPGTGDAPRRAAGQSGGISSQGSGRRILQRQLALQGIVERTTAIARSDAAPPTQEGGRAAGEEGSVSFYLCAAEDRRVAQLEASPSFMGHLEVCVCVCVCV
jgi:hypothetical protein